MIATTLRSIAFSTIIALFAASGTIAPTFAQNQNESSRSEFPGRRVGGGTRDNYCEANSRALVALNPVNNLGITASDNPALYFVLPDLENTYAVSFLLQDQTGNIVYKTTVETPNTQRQNSQNPNTQRPNTRQFMEIALPENILTKNQDYQWRFELACNPFPNVILSGWLRRVTAAHSVDPSGVTAASLTHQLEQVEMYQASELWNDAIAAMVTLYQAHPHHPEVQTAWTELLEALKLQPFVKPIVALDD